MSEKYLDDNGTQILINQIKENCTLKVSTLPIASADELGKIYQYIGTTSGSIVHNYFYECVSDGAVTPTYTWQQVNIQPTAGTPTAATTTFDNTTSELQATNVQDAIDEVDATVDGLSTDVDNIKDVVPSTATSSNKLVDHDSLGTAAFKDSTDRVSPNNTALVESQSVYSAINTALSSIYTPRGDITCAELTSALLIEANVGNIYETSDSGTTTALFLQGAGVPIPTGSNVGIISAGQGRILFNLMANAFDLTDYQKKDLTSAVEGQTTVEGALGELSTNKADKVSSATNGDFAGLDANGNLTDSGKKASDFATAERLENEVVTRSAMGAKNLIPFPYPKASNTVLGIDFTTNSNGEVIATGTSTGIAVYDVVNTELYGWNNIPREGTYILSDGLSDADYVYAYTAVTFMYDDGTIEYNVGDTSVGRTVITIPSNLKNFYIGCCVRTDKTVSNIKFKPMLRLATDADSTYQLYAMTNQQLTQETNSVKQALSNEVTTRAALGAHNLLPNNIQSQVANGVTITRNADGSLTFEKTGTVSATTLYLFKDSLNPIKLTSPCKLTSGAVYENTALIATVNGTDYVCGTSTEEVSLPSGNMTRVRYYFNSSFTGTLTLKPMIRLVTDSDTTYQPYAMTNRELTNITTLLDMGLVSTGLTFEHCIFTAGGFAVLGNLVIINLRISATNEQTNKHVKGLPPYTGSGRVALSCIDYATGEIVPCTMSNEGDITIITSTTNGYMISGTYVKSSSV